MSTPPTKKNYSAVKRDVPLSSGNVRFPCSGAGALNILRIFFMHDESFSLVEIKPWPFSFEWTTLPETDTSKLNGTLGAQTTFTEKPAREHRRLICRATFRANAGKPQLVPWRRSMRMLATSLSTVAPPPQDDITKFVFSLVFTITMKWREIDKSFTLFKIDISFHSGLFLNKKLEVLYVDYDYSRLWYNSTRWWFFCLIFYKKKH